MSNKYNRREFLGQLSVGCASVGLTTLLSGVTNMGLLNAAAIANAPYGRNNDYKALVCIMLGGGNDSFNMLIPRNTTEYQHYADVRQNIKIEYDQLLPINPLNTNGKLYGLHPSMPNIQGLFEAGNAAFVANIGALIEPMTLSGYFAGQRKPLGLFSHPDQQKHWQTSVPQDRNALGWGGRLADILQSNNGNQGISMSISLNGLNTFQRGTTTQAYTIEANETGSVRLNNFDDTGFHENIKRQTLDNLLDNSYQNTLQKAYANVVSGSKNSSLEFSSAISSGTPLTTTYSDDEFSQQLKMIARTIAAKDILNVSRQTFFVFLDKFDTHDDVLNQHADLLGKMDDGLKSFYDSLAELGVENDVTTFTISDFGRRLVSNGDGTDHAWGGHALMLGGAVDGQKIYGQYPDVYLGNPLDIGNGRILPTTSCDEYFAELALWFGASTGDLDQILPNINNFWTPTAGSRPIGFLM